MHVDHSLPDPPLPPDSPNVYIPVDIPTMLPYVNSLPLSDEEIAVLEATTIPVSTATSGSSHNSSPNNLTQSTHTLPPAFAQSQSPTSLLSLSPCLLLPHIIAHLTTHPKPFAIVPCCIHKLHAHLTTTSPAPGCVTAPFRRHYKASSSLPPTPATPATICQTIADYIAKNTTLAVDVYPLTIAGRQVPPDLHVLVGRPSPPFASSPSASSSVDLFLSFWDIELTGTEQLAELVPTFEDFEAARAGEDEGGDVVKHYDLPCGRVSVFENYNDGCLSRIGSETWDAGIVFTMMLPTVLPAGLPPVARCLGILELGSGVGTVGCALAYHIAGLVPRPLLTLSDYQDDVLRLLRKTVGNLGDSARVDVAKLDWFRRDTWGLPGSYDLIVGTAVVYSPDHEVVADVVSHCLREGGRAVILQMVTRPGVDRFLRRCEALALQVDIEEIDEQILAEAAAVRGKEIGGAEDMRLFTLTRS